MLSWQADDVLPTWILRYVGALKIHVQRTNFILGMFTTMNTAYIVYYTTPLPSLTIPTTAIQPFTTVYGWLGLVAVIALAFLFVDRAVLYPAEVSYNSHQASRRDRNPGYDVTVDTNERIQRIENALDIDEEEETEDA